MNFEARYGSGSSGDDVPREGHDLLLRSPRAPKNRPGRQDDRFRCLRRHEDQAAGLSRERAYLRPAFVDAARRIRPRSLVSGWDLRRRILPSAWGGTYFFGQPKKEPHVCSPTIPSTTNPWAAWYWRTAASVTGPKSRSIVIGSARESRSHLLSSS